MKHKNQSETLCLCITSYDQDIYILDNLLNHLKLQTVNPDSIILYCSGIDSLNSPNYILINNKLVKIDTIISSKRTIQSIARNICSSISSADIVVFFDIDDIPHPQKIEATKKYINNYDFLLHSYTRNINSNSNILDLNSIHSFDSLDIDKQSTNISCQNKHIHHSHIAVKKHCFDSVRFNESIQFYRKEDGKFCQDLLLNNFKGIFLDAPLVTYNQKIYQ